MALPAPWGGWRGEVQLRVSGSQQLQGAQSASLGPGWRGEDACAALCGMQGQALASEPLCPWGACQPSPLHRGLRKSLLSPGTSLWGQQASRWGITGQECLDSAVSVLI